jgi:hypothetical protein
MSIVKWHVAIMAGGDQTRFGGADNAKHLVEVLGEPILKRTIRLTLENSESFITVIVPPGRISQYKVIEDPRVNYLERPLRSEQKIESALETSLGSDLIILWGDVFFNRNSLYRILNDTPSDGLEAYCRYGHSEITKKPWGEIFGLRIQSEFRNKLAESTRWVKNAFESGEIYRDGSWEVFKHYSGLENLDGYRAHPRLPFYREINDFTEDIDFPEDYQNMLLNIPRNLEDALDFISDIHSKSMKQKQTLEQEKQTLEQENQTLEQEKQTLEQEKQTLETVLIQTLNSRSWRFTKPLRRVFKFMRTRV